MKEAQRLFNILKLRKLTISTAESCTGGKIAAALTDIPGSSAVFSGGFVTYQDIGKERDVNVSKKSLEKHTAVSLEVSLQIALGALKKTGSDMALSTTGVAGPGKGEYGKPVGLVYISCAFRNKVVTRRCFFKGSRAAIRLAATKEAFRLGLDTFYKYGIKT